VGELSLQLLGSFRVLDSTGREVRIASRKGRALLAYLAMRPGESHARDRLATLLWEDADEELARTSLRQALAALRKALPSQAQPALLSDTESVGIDSTLVRSDIAEFRRSLMSGTRTSLQEAMASYRGDLLDGFDARSTAFDEWVSSERLSLRKQMSELLQKLTGLCNATDDVDGAVAACARLVSIEPLNESAHRTLMELHAKRNAYAEALRQYRICRDVLRRELDVSPEPATEQLYRDIMRKRRIAVNGSDQEDALIADHEIDTPAPAAVPSRSRLENRPELRDAVILVAKLEGLLEIEAQLDPEESHRLASEFQSRVQAAVHEFGGATDRRVGSNVLAAFGVPNAYGNEAERAARAALMLRDLVAQKPWSVAGHLGLRIGIAQGQVLCGRELFPLTGRPTHVAHALASAAAEGDILISEDLKQSLGGRVTTQRAGTMLQPGADTQSAWILQSLRNDGSPDSQPFVGRRPELAMILAGLDRCASSRHGRAIVVRGEAGIGKTRLVDIICAAARERNVSVHSAQVFDFGQSPGRRPITTLALSLMGVRPESTPGERAAAVRRIAVARGGSIDQIIFLSDLIDAPLDAELVALEKAMEVATRQRGRALALAQIIESASQRGPQLLVVEDVHWADTDELARLGEVAAVVANCQILFIMTTRPEGDPISATWRARARGCPVTTVDLAPLAEDEAQELAAHYPELSRETIAACIHRADGYPLFLDQLLRAASAGHDSLPGSVRSLVLARADQVSSQDLLALQASAVLGQRAAVEPLRRMIADPDYEPTRLVDTALVRYDGVDLEFVHALFRDAIYESTLKSQRRELHRAAAAWYASSDPALYADHLAAADDEHAAGAYMEAAAAEGRSLHFERALALANKASALAREPVMLHKTSVLLGELLLQVGRTHDALTAFREALDFAIDQPGYGNAWFGIASALRIMDRHEEALEALDRGEAAFGEAVDAHMRARMCTLRGNLCFPLGRLDACLQAHEQAHRHAVEAQSPLDIARALGGLGDAYYQRGHMLTARDRFAKCIAEAREHGLVGVLLANLPMHAISQTYCGNPAAGRDSLKEAVELARRIGDLRGELLAHLCMATALLVQAQWDECRASAHQCLDLAKQLGARRFQAECLGIIAATLLHDGQRAEALRMALEALQHGRETSMTYCGPVLLSIVARATDDSEQRAQVLKEGEELLAAGCVSHSYFEFYSNAIEVSLEQSQWQELRRYSDGLRSYTADERLPLTDMQIARATLLADIGEKRATSDTCQKLEALREECRRMNALAALPAVEKALAAMR
jgi:DNA-binding SARP family transcriptional activator/class 3 adenylate cyclase/tetratricopeptide (TPR) repeat protein